MPKKAVKSINLDSLNDALAAGLMDEGKQAALDEGFNVIGQFVYDHGNTPKEAFNAAERLGKSIIAITNEEVLEMMLTEVCDGVLNG